MSLEMFKLLTNSSRLILWRIFVTIGTFALMTAQLYYICQQFFNHDVVTRVIIKRPDQFYPPSLSVCFSGPQEEKYRKRTFPTELFEEMPSILNLIDRVEVNNWASLEPSSSADFDKKWTVVKSIKDQSYCYTFNYQGDPFETKQVLNNPFAPFLYSILFRNDKFIRNKTVTIYMHSRNVLNSAQENAYLTISEDNSSISETQLTYDLYQSELLESPYITDCWFYDRTFNFRTQGNCIDSCLLEHYIRNLSLISGESLIQEHDDYPKQLRFDEWADYENKTFLNVSIDIEIFCRNLICSKKDCFRVEFVPVVQKVEPSENLTITVNPSKAPEFNVKFAPSINPIDFVTYVLSTIGFWTGFAPLSLSWYRWTKLEHSISKCKSRKQEHLYGLIRTIQLTIDLEKQYTRQQFNKIFLDEKVIVKSDFILSKFLSGKQ